MNLIGKQTMSRFEGEGSNKYDARISRLVPGYELIHLLTTAQLLARLPEEATILVVGAGTGHEILQLASQRTAWKFVAVDLSADMLAVAQKRFAEAEITDRVQLHVGDIATLKQELMFDAALLLLVMHFLPDNGRKQGLLTEIAKRLKLEAPLFLADLMLPVDDVERFVQGQASMLLGMEQTAVNMMLARLKQDFYPIDYLRLNELCNLSGYHTPIPYSQALGFQAFVALRFGESKQSK